jgi:hypothetical protein
VPLRRECDERQVDSIEHQLNRHKNRDDVALDQKPGHTAGEQNAA